VYELLQVFAPRLIAARQVTWMSFYFCVL